MFPVTLGHARCPSSSLRHLGSATSSVPVPLAGPEGIRPSLTSLPGSRRKAAQEPVSLLVPDFPEILGLSE